MMNKPIRALPVPTRNRLRSTQTLTTLPQIVSELLQNAIDAGARHVDVGVDRDDWSCWVRDDGHGISKENMSLLADGSEESRYATSKAYDPDSLNVLATFGFRGEALASAADLCCLEISSRASTSRDTWSVILKGGKTLYRGTAVRWRRELPGTTVVVRDAFYNLPVRRRAHPPATRTFELIRQELETYALVFPCISFTLERSNGQGQASEAIVKIPKTPSTLQTFQHLFGKALVKHVDNIEIRDGDLMLEGFVSLDGAPSKTHQFLYINKHPIAIGELHRVIDARFSASSFSKNAYDESGESTLRSTVRMSPRKTEKRPVYVLNLTVPSHCVDNCLEPAKMNVQLQNTTSVIALLSTAIQSFLIRHGFLTHPNATKEKQESSPHPRKRMRIEAEDSGYAETIDTQPDDDNDEANCQHPSRPLFTESAHFPMTTGNVLWTDPNTGQVFIVDSRTGNSRSMSKAMPGEGAEQDASTSCRLNFPRRETANSGPAIPKWIEDALMANDVYTSKENTIPSVQNIDTRGTTFHNPNHQLRTTQSCGYPQQSTSFQTNGLPLSSSSHRYGKDDLLNAHVVNQVDKKFIVCLIDDTGKVDVEGSRQGGNGRALVLIDQHAADERVRVERFLKPFCRGFLNASSGVSDKTKLVKTRELSPAKPILLTTYEASRLAGSLAIQSIFRNWGFGFNELGDVSGGSQSHGVTTSESGYVQIMVGYIPEVVSDKLLVGEELRDLVRAIVANPPASVANVEDAALSSGSAESGEKWVKALRWCPRELLELVNSKACRGAIMFNDALRIDQCERLVSQLAETVFPFQCAHGRPSLVPLTAISSMERLPKGAELCWSRLEDSSLD